MITQKNKSNNILNVLLSVMLICTLFGALFFINRKSVSAKAAAATTDITDTLTLENRNSEAWKNNCATADDEYYFGVVNDGAYLNTADNISGCWYIGNNDVLSANNNGVDILEYIYVNGKSAKSLNTENVNGAQLTGTIGWLANPAASPVLVQTSSAAGNMGIQIHILKAAVSEPITLTFKKGFSVIDPNGETLAVSDDVEFTIDATGVPTKVVECTLSFEGLDETITVVNGQAIGELPEIPEVEGKVAFYWQIDGVEITAETVYNYGVDKTATIVYYEGTDIIDTLDMSNWGTVAGNDCTYIRVGNQMDADGNLIIPTAFNNIHWQDGYMTQTANNFGCDLMEYIYINGKSARSISTENGQNGTYGGEGKTFPFNYGGLYAPIDVYTNGNEFFILVMTDYVAKDDLVITLKAGFRMATSDGGMLYLSQDFVFPYYTVTFDGVAKKVSPNTAVAEPVEPTKAETESHTYAFDGWYNGEVKWDFATPVTENLNLTAKFIATEKAKYTVTFNADNGETAMGVSVYVNACVKAEQIPANPEKAGDGTLAYTFLYWSVDGENAYDFDTPITQDITLTAIYTTKTLYTVKTGDATQKVIDGEKAVKPADPTKDPTAEYEYIFEGWYNGETKWDFENDVVNADIELVAKFTEAKRKYTLSFNVMGNDVVTLDPVAVEYGTTYDLSNLLDGKDVSGYSYKITVKGEAVTSVEVLADVTVDVVFVARVYYTVTVDGVEQTVEEGEKALKPEVEPAKASTAEYEYTFEGWYNGETKWDFENDVVNVDLELVAKFTETKRKYTITFVVTGNDAVTLDRVVVEYGTTYDLSNLLADKDVSGYTYSISVGGVEKSNFKVITDTTVSVVFTKKAGDSNKKNSSGCGSMISGASVLLSTMALSVVAVIKKKEN